MPHGDTDALQQLGRADPGELQQLGRLQCAGTQYHLAVAVGHMVLAELAVAHTRHPVSLQHQAGGLGVTLNAQIGSTADWLEKA
jgi:hypothetical protein